MLRSGRKGKIPVLRRLEGSLDGRIDNKGHDENANVDTVRELERADIGERYIVLIRTIG